MRTASLIMLSGLFVQLTYADEIRHATFPNVMLGTWAETAEQCAAKDKTNIAIEPTKYRDGRPANLSRHAFRCRPGRQIWDLRLPIGLKFYGCSLPVSWAS
jgi:hypothetical protein